MGLEKRVRDWLDVGIVDVDNRVRRTTCFVELTVFGGFGLGASLSVSRNSAISAMSIAGMASLASLYVLVWFTTARPVLWNWFMPGVAVASALGVLQLGSAAHILLTPACLGVFWAAVILSTRQVYVGTVAVSAAMVLQYIPLGVTLTTTISVVGALTSNVIAAVLFHSIVMSMRKTRFELESAREAAVIHSLTDPLTGLPNRRRSPGTTVLDEPAALLLIDIDRFKSINDRFGHAFGDAVLCEVAARATAVEEPLSEHFEVLRWGGDEFVVIARGPNPGDIARSLGESIRDAVATTAVARGRIALRVSVSIGAAVWPRGERLETALAQADGALYAAKRSGRDRVEIALSVPRAPAGPPSAHRYNSDRFELFADPLEVSAHRGDHQSGPATRVRPDAGSRMANGNS